MTAPLLMSASTLSLDEKAQLFGLASNLISDRHELELRDHYYNGSQRMRDFGISIPPQMQKIHAVLGWPRVNVDSLEERLDIQGFRYPDDTVGDDYLLELWQYNNMDEESQLAHLDAIIFGWAFATVGTNDIPGDAFPILSVESPLDMTAVYDARRREITAALRLYADDDEMFGTLYLPNDTISIAAGESGNWEVVERDTHNQGIVPVVRLSNRQRIADRRGSSEINNEVMSITDAACRTLLGVEVAREFYSAPQRYILGAPESAFQNADGTPKTAWQTYLGRVLAFERDEEGDIPTVGQFDPYSPAVYSDVMDMYGKLMVAQTGLPPQYLGLTFENPTSADAIRMGEQRLVKRAERRQRGFSGGWEDLVRLALRWGTGSLPSGAERIATQWRDAATPTLAAQVDATVKLVTAGILPPDSDVALEMSGFDPAQRTRIAQDRKRAQAQAARQALMTTAVGAGARTVPKAPQATSGGLNGASNAA